MIKVLIVGAGCQRAPCASILSRDRNIAETVLADIDLDLANKIKGEVGSNKISAMKFTAEKVEEIERAAKGADAIINLILPQFNSNIMEAALNSGAQYVDTAVDYPLIAQLAKRGPLEMDSEFNKAGLTATIGCGGTPGLSDVLVKFGTT